MKRVLEMERDTEAGSWEMGFADWRLQQRAHWSLVEGRLWRTGSCERLMGQLVRPLGRCLHGAWIVLERDMMVRR
jgi:hypothetical protein